MCVCVCVFKYTSFCGMLLHHICLLYVLLNLVCRFMKRVLMALAFFSPENTSVVRLDLVFLLLISIYAFNIV